MRLMENTISRRRVVLSAVAATLVGCGRPSVRGEMSVLTALSKRSRTEGLAVALLGSDVLYARYFFDPTNTRFISLPPEATRGRPSLLTDWGRALLVQDGEWLRINDLSGGERARFQRVVNVDDCAVAGTRLLFWGEEIHAEFYGVF